MNKLPIKTIVEGLLKLQETGDSATILGIGPMSKNCVQATLELSKDEDFPVMFIASRNQVDSDEFGGGYVNGWDQKRFAAAVEEVADEIGYDNFYYLCRDHGGPWQRDKERNDHLPVDVAMEIGKKSYLADIEAGFDLLMIDPTKDPFEIGKVTKKRPFAINEEMSTPYKILVLSDEYYNKTFKDEKRYSAYYKVKDASKVKNQIEESLKDYKQKYIANVQETYNDGKHLITLVGIFLYGFIIIIILIGVTNIVNTITTSMELRKQEFAILRSVGMTNKEFNRMIRLETLFIGIKSLFFGIPLGTAISYGIYQAGNMPFEIPLKPILYSAIAVIVLIASIMQYSLIKIKKQNTIETIRNENI